MLIFGGQWTLNSAINIYWQECQCVHLKWGCLCPNFVLSDTKNDWWNIKAALQVCTHYKLILMQWKYMTEGINENVNIFRRLFNIKPTIDNSRPKYFLQNRRRTSGRPASAINSRKDRWKSKLYFLVEFCLCMNESMSMIRHFFCFGAYLIKGTNFLKLKVTLSIV